MAKAVFNSQQDCIEAVKKGEAGQEALRRFILDEERAGRIDELAGTIEARLTEYISAQLMDDSYNIVEASRFNDFYDLMLRTSKTLRKRENKTQEETARQLESIGIEWDAKIKWPTPKHRPRLLTDGMYRILSRLAEKGITEQVNEYQFIWIAEEGATLYGFFCKQVSEPLGLYANFSNWTDWAGFSEIFVNGEDMRNTAKSEASRGTADNGTETINKVLNDYRNGNF